MMGQVVSKTRSLDQIIEKPCVNPRDILCPILRKLDKNLCFNEIQVVFENLSSRFKNYVTGSNLGKTMCAL